MSKHGNPKDGWDKAQIIGDILGKTIIAALVAVAAYNFNAASNKQQEALELTALKQRKLQIAESLIQHVTTSESSKSSALVTMASLGDEDVALVAIRLAEMEPSIGSLRALAAIATWQREGVSALASEALGNMFSAHRSSIFRLVGTEHVTAGICLSSGFGVVLGGPVAVESEQELPTLALSWDDSELQVAHSIFPHSDILIVQLKQMPAHLSCLKVRQSPIAAGELVIGASFGSEEVGAGRIITINERYVAVTFPGRESGYQPDFILDINASPVAILEEQGAIPIIESRYLRLDKDLRQLQTVNDTERDRMLATQD